MGVENAVIGILRHPYGTAKPPESTLRGLLVGFTADRAGAVPSLSAVQPLANVVCDYACHNGQKEFGDRHSDHLPSCRGFGDGDMIIACSMQFDKENPPSRRKKKLFLPYARKAGILKVVFVPKRGENKIDRLV